jgi:hypothetical protein
MLIMELRNESKNVFVDISSEEFREYQFKEFETIRINSPLYLSISKNGHRILDAEGTSHFVPGGWIHLKWKAKENQPHFVK